VHLGLLSSHVLDFDADQLEAAALEARNDLTHQATLDGIGLDGDKCSL